MCISGVKALGSIVPIDRPEDKGTVSRYGPLGGLSLDHPWDLEQNCTDQTRPPPPLRYTDRSGGHGEDISTDLSVPIPNSIRAYVSVDGGSYLASINGRRRREILGLVSGPAVDKKLSAGATGQLGASIPARTNAAEITRHTSCVLYYTWNQKST
ncbi:hypothetical protein CIB48_g8723 [Xylaria polymorpha]|nr:hypothetical protein CIB48_g8723 [Xylaria polymorpha]